MRIFLSIIILLLVSIIVTKSWAPLLILSIIIFAIICISIINSKNNIDIIILDKSDLSNDYMHILDNTNSIDDKNLN